MRHLDLMVATEVDSSEKCEISLHLFYLFARRLNTLSYRASNDVDEFSRSVSLEALRPRGLKLGPFRLFKHALLNYFEASFQIMGSDF
jgi:hypothetical protein